MEINFHGDKVVKSDVTIHREVFLFFFTIKKVSINIYRLASFTSVSWFLFVYYGINIITNAVQ